MNLTELQAAESKLLLQTYDRYPLMFVRGEGVHLFDEHNTPYLDLLSGIGVCALGYNHPAITAAITAQAATLIHTSNLIYHSGTTELALRLTEITGLDRVFLCNSGTEAWEAALKLARAHAGLLRAEGKQIGTKFLALEHSFHGRTMGSVATTHKRQYREPFAPVMPDVEFIPFNDVAALRAAFSTDVCGIAIECLQGEGGINSISAEFLAAARALCDSTGALLLCDEIQSGMGRTGKWCAYQHYGIQPDVTTLAKPLAGGIPIGACSARKRPRAPSLPACTAPPSAATRSPAPPPSPSSTPSSSRSCSTTCAPPATTSSPRSTNSKRSTPPSWTYAASAS
jgi:acetylornithine/N-succinyldiaminopimelate aminotransferase